MWDNIALLHLYELSRIDSFIRTVSGVEVSSDLRLGRRWLAVVA